MPNVFTRVPERPVPPLAAWTRGILRVADLFMVAMWSRPPTGTLATSWVTPATLYMCATLAAVAAALAVALLIAAIGGSGAIAVALSVLLLLLAAGSGAVAAVGVAQRTAG